jgi:hypothetical protein
MMMLSNLFTLFALLWWCPCTALVAQKPSSSTLLDGYAFDCGGSLLLGFQGVDQIVCLTGGKKVQCGNYMYSEHRHVLTGRTALMGDFLAYNMDIQNHTLVSFQSDIGVSCHAVSLDWPTYSTNQFLGLKCPSQNEIPTLSYEDNHFSLGLSGDVALRSPLEFTSSGRRLVLDLYGIYQWNALDESLRIYFGPQQGKPLTVLTGRLTHQGQLFVEGYVPPGPCLHDGASALMNATELPSHEQDVDSGMSTQNASSSGGDWNSNPIPFVLEDSGEDMLPYYSASATERLLYWILLGIAFVGLGALSSSC